MVERTALSSDQVESVYRQLLGREPAPEEIEAQLAAWPDLDALLRVIVDSQEFRERLRNADARAQALVNIYHPDLARFGPPPGTRSADGNAIVGHRGMLLLCGGTNANLEQFVGAAEMPPGWLEEWREVIGRRKEEIAALGVAAALLVVPDKLAVYEDYYPESLVKVGPRPIERLLESHELELIYPLASMQAAARNEDVYLRTDTHLTFRGNELLFLSLLEALAIAEAPDFSTLPMHSYPSPGDLGTKFEPQIVSIVSEPNTLRAAEIVADNRGEIEAVGGHIGTRRVFRNDEAPDRRLAVVFGDSFGYASSYYQGISWFLAQVFREVHFVWVPFGWDPEYVRRTGAEAVLIQGAERFVARVPRLRVEVAELAAETLRRKRPISLEAIMD